MKTRAAKPRIFTRSPLQLAIISLFAGASPAHGQVAADTPTTVLPEVVVTATKRATSLQRTPIAVTALNASDLEKAQVQTIADIAHLVPSFQGTTQGDHGVITMTLRGIGNDSAKTEYADPEKQLHRQN